LPAGGVAGDRDVQIFRRITRGWYTPRGQKGRHGAKIANNGRPGATLCGLRYDLALWQWKLRVRPDEDKNIQVEPAAGHSLSGPALSDGMRHNPTGFG